MRLAGQILCIPRRSLVADTKMTTLLDRAEALFRARPGEWIDGREIADVASRRRIRELLRTRHGMVIENRLRRMTTRRINQDSAQCVISEYRWVPERELDLSLIFWGVC